MIARRSASRMMVCEARRGRSPWVRGVDVAQREARRCGSWKAPMATATIGAISSPRGTIRRPDGDDTPDGTAPSRGGAAARQRGPGRASGPGGGSRRAAARRRVDPPSASRSRVGHFCATTFSAAAACWAWVGNVERAGRAPAAGPRSAALSTVPSVTSVDSSIGRASPCSHRFWPVDRVQVLLPQPGRGRVRRGLADRLVVVGGVAGVRRDHDLEALDGRLDLGGQQVVPPDHDRGLAALARWSAPAVTGTKLPTCCAAS